MALGLLLVVSCICFILFNGGAALPAVKGYRYPHMPDVHNIGDDAEDQVFLSSNVDQSELQASNNELSGPVYTSYNNPPAEQQPDPASSQPYIQSPTFSYEPGHAVAPQPDPVQPLGPAYQEPEADYPSLYAGHPEPVSSAYEDNSVYSQAEGHSRETPHLAYEEVFHNPSEHLESPLYEDQSGNAPHLVYEEVFHNPPDHLESPLYEDQSGNAPHLVYEEVFHNPSEHLESPLYEDQSGNSPHLVYEEVFQYSTEQAEPPLYEHHSSNNPYLVYEEVFEYPSEHAQSHLYEDDSGYTPHLVYEDVFQYPSEQAASSSYENIHNQAGYNSASSEQALPVNPLGPRSFSGGLNLNSGETDEPKPNKITRRRPKPANRRAQKPLAPLLLPPRTNAMIQSGKAHKPRYFLSHLNHKPELPALKTLKLKIQRPALLKKAAHKVLRSQRYGKI